MLTTNCGTPVYMAPEIWKGVEYNQKVDIWSVGVVMYYLLSGTHPFDGDNEDLGKEIINSELTFPDDVWRPISSKGIFLLILILSDLKSLPRYFRHHHFFRQRHQTIN